MVDADPTAFVRTLRLKVRAESYPWLNAAAVEVNQAWNFCNAGFRGSARPFQDDYGNLVFGKRLSGFDLCSRTAGMTRFTKFIGADTIQRVCTEYGSKIKAAFPRQRLSWRASRGSRRSLGWIPFKAASLKRKGNGLRFAGKSFRIFDREYLGDLKWRDGGFAQDSCGDWWICLPVIEAAEQTVAPHEAVGIDLGLKTIATTSDGETLEAGRWTHAYANKLATAQRRGHKRQAKRIHRKIKRCRANALHKFSRSIVDRYQTIIVGDVSSTKLTKTRMAKSVLDSGWGMFKNMLDYKSQQAARTFSVINESYSTRACSSCGALTGPSGLRQLVVRQWTCSACGDAHDRDVNAARNIRTVGLRCRASVCGNESLPDVIRVEPSITARARQGKGARHAAA